MPTMTDTLQLAGMQKMSSVDWPGKLVATVFAQGCPWECGYCHNHAIIDCRTPGVIPWDDVVAFMKRRVGLLDGIVFSGGEATRQRALFDAAREIKDMGFAVGLHTAGPYPRALRELLEAELIDWVGIDVKATTENYPAVVGRPRSGEKAWESLDILLDYAKRNPHFSYEVRLTAFPQSPGDELAVALACRMRGVSTFALQQARSEGAPDGFVATRTGWDDQFNALVNEIEVLGFSNLIVRRS